MTASGNIDAAPDELAQKILADLDDKHVVVSALLRKEDNGEENDSFIIACKKQNHNGLYIFRVGMGGGLNGLLCETVWQEFIASFCSKAVRKGVITHVVYHIDALETVWPGEQVTAETACLNIRLSVAQTGTDELAT